MKKQHIVVFCTIPDIRTAERIAKSLVEGKLAACCNILPGITSIYTWKNKIENESELLLVIKSHSDIFNLIKEKITELHPYDVPEIIALPIIAGNENYLNWIDENVKKG